MKTKITTTVFIIFSAVLVIGTSFNFMNSDKIIDLGYVILVHKQKNIPLPLAPLLAIAMLFSSVMIMFLNKKRSIWMLPEISTFNPSINKS